MGREREKENCARMRVQMCDTETTVTGDDDDSPMLGALQDVGVDMKGRGEFAWNPLDTSRHNTYDRAVDRQVLIVLIGRAYSSGHSE